MPHNSVRSTRTGDLLQLVRPRLSAMVALAAVSGCLAAPAPVSLPTALAVAGAVLLLTAAASSFNQVQERAEDRLQPRTCNRPVACGRMPPRAALLTASLLLAVGMLLLFAVSPAAAAVGAAAVAWYNLLYTPLKRRSSLALLVGALGGAAPPLLGWVASGASPFEPRAVHLYLLLVLWQVPHFCCLSLRDNLRCQQVGLKVIPRQWNAFQVVRQVRLWSLGLATLLLGTLPLAQLHSTPGRLLVLTLALWCASLFVTNNHSRDTRRWAAATGVKLHMVLAGALLLFSIDPLIPF